MKQTEIGEIPEDWDLKKLGQILKIRHGKSQKEVISDSGIYPILATGGEIGRATQYLYNKPSVLIGRKGTIDKPRYQDTPFWTVDTLFYSEISPNYSVKFIYYKFCMIDWLKNNEASGVPSQTSKAIENLEIILPNKIEEQNKIAEVLTDTDNLIQATEQLINKKKLIKTATMQNLLTGKIRLAEFDTKQTKPSELGEIPSDWDILPLEKIGKVITGGTPSTNNPMFWNGEYAWITPTDISENKDIYLSERNITFAGLTTIRALPKDSLLVTCIASIGKNAILRVEGACNQQINAVVPFDNSDIDFLYYSLEMGKERLKAKAGITATLIISKALFSTFILALPTLGEQKAIAEILSDMDNELTALNDRLTKLKAIKLGLMQNLLTGKIRLTE